MSWYFAKIIFLIVHEEGLSELQFDEQLRLVQASTLQEALEKALSIAGKEEQEFPSSSSRRVSWKFLGIPELYKLGHLEDGKLICSLSPGTDDPTAYLEYVKQKYSILKGKVFSPGALVNK